MCKVSGCNRKDIKAKNLCTTHYNQKWYKENRERHKKNLKKNKTRYKKESKKLVSKAKEEGCSRCGFEDQRALQFHHPKDSEKHKSVGRLVSESYPPSTVKKEIEKCEILCANCHRIEHASVAKQDKAARF